MEIKDKKYLFISQRAEIQLFTTDNDGYLKEKIENLSIPHVGTDTRVAVFEKAVYDKIKIHYRLDKSEVTLNEKVEHTLNKLVTENRVVIHFDASGRPKEHVFFNKEDEETHFYFDKLTATSVKELEYKIEKIVGEPLSIFNEIYISDALLKQNSLLQLIFNPELRSRTVTDSASIARRQNELNVLKILTPEERKTEEERRKKEAEADFIHQGESGNFVSLQKTWQQTDLSLYEQIIACLKFQETYPNSQNRILVTSKLLGFQDKDAWEKADKIKTIDAYLDYLIQFKEGSFKDAAKRCVLNLEIAYKNAVEPLQQQLKAATAEIDRRQEEIDTLEGKASGFGKKSKLLMFGIVLALLAGFGVSQFLLKKNTVLIAAENPLCKRVDALIESRIYPKQQQLVQDSKGVVAGSNEVYELLKIQEKLSKALFDCHKVKFDLIPQSDAQKIPPSEVEKEINRIENAIK